MGELEASASRDCIIMEFAAELIVPDDKQQQSAQWRSFSTCFLLEPMRYRGI